MSKELFKKFLRNFSFGKDISKTRLHLKANLELFKTRTIQNSLIELYNSYNPGKEILFPPGISDLNLHSKVNNSIQSFIENEFEINFYLTAIVEFIYSISTNDETIINKYYDFYKKRKLIDDEKSKFNPTIYLQGESQDSDIYDLLFMLTIRQTPAQKISSLLDYQFAIYQGDFNQFLTIAFDEYKDFLSSTQIMLIEKWITNRKTPFHRSSLHWRDKKGDKIDLLRIFLSIYDLKLIQDNNGQIPSQEKLIKELSRFFNIDLTNYEQDLSNGLKSSQEKNIGIFRKLEKSILDRHIKAQK